MSSVIVTFARDMSGLDDSQVRGIYHSLMKEDAGNKTEEYSEENLIDSQRKIISAIERGYSTGRLKLGPNSKDPSLRLLSALGEKPEHERIFAANRLIDRCLRAAKAQRVFIQGFARDVGSSETAAEYEFQSAYQQAVENKRLVPSAAFRKAWLSNPDNTNMPCDRRSLYAFERMEIARANAHMLCETKPSVIRKEVSSSIIKEIGYDPITGRCEIIKKENNKVNAYKMNDEEYEEFAKAPDLEQYYQDNIRGNEKYQYNSIKEEAESRQHYRCPTCGQWTSAGGHYCPVLDSKEGYNRDLRIAVERARARAAGDYRDIPTIIEPVKIAPIHTTRYCIEGDEDSGIYRFRGVSRLRQDSRQYAAVMTPVSAVFPAAELGKQSANVSGNVIVEYEGRGLGYSILPATEPGDTREDNLKCSCEEYRKKYHCKHVDYLLDNMREIVNDSISYRRIAADNSVVENLLEKEHENSLQASTLSEKTFIPRKISLVSDEKKFNQLYNTVQKRIRKYKNNNSEYPIPYNKNTGALGGLCSRESGRGFGIELEYSFPLSMTEEEVATARENIGKELYSLGLTDTIEQKETGASHDKPPKTEHERGWSYEQDLSTGKDGEALYGGEIVSPLMYDEADTWENLEKVCNVIKNNGGIASKQSGSHVHMGAGDYDHTVANYNRLLSYYGSNEDLLYRLSTNPETKTHRGRMYCNPNRLPSTPYVEVGSAQDRHSGQVWTINMKSMSGQSTDHVEFRSFDATLNPSVLQTQVLVTAGLTAAATREKGNPRPNRSRTPLGTWSSRKIEERKGEETMPVRSFIDKYIPGGEKDDEDNRAIQILSLFAMTRWQKENI